MMKKTMIQIIALSTIGLSFFAAKLAAVGVTNDATAYYLQTSGNTLLSIPSGAATAQGVKNVYMVQSVTGAGAAPQIPAPSCPGGYMPQIFVSPVSFYGGNVMGSAPGTISPLYGVSAYAVQNPANWVATVTQANAPGVGWDVYTTTLSANGVSQAGTNAWVMVVTSCCNPNDPTSNCQTGVPG